MGMLIHRRRMAQARLRKEQQQAAPTEEEKAKERLKELGHKKGKKGRRTKAEVAEQQKLAEVANGPDD